jgi:hypothetical protein
MRRMAIPSLVSSVMVTLAGTAIPSTARAESLVQPQDSNSYRREELATTTTQAVDDRPNSDRLITQLFYPAVGDGQTFRVIGKGRATGAADTARVEFKFSSNTPSEEPPEGTTSQFELQATPLTKESFKPIVDALVGIGVPANAIEVKISESRRNALPFPFPSSETGGAQVVVNLDQPVRERVDRVVTVVNQAASKSNKLSVDSVGVQYSVKDCRALERAAYQAAMKDAQERARAIADAIGAELGKVPSVAEPFYDVFLSRCSSGGNFPFGENTPSYEPNAPAEVEVKKDIFVSFPVK